MVLLQNPLLMRISFEIMRFCRCKRRWKLNFATEPEQRCLSDHAFIYGHLPATSPHDSKELLDRACFGLQGLDRRDVRPHSRIAAPYAQF
jgi:hypothetical protein